MWPAGGGGGGVGGTVEVGEPMAGLPAPPPPPLFGNTTGLGLVAGGRSSLKEGTEEERAEEEREGEVADGSGLRGCVLAGRKEEGTSLADEALRWSGWACDEPLSLSRSRREWSGLEGSDAPPPPPPTPFSCSSVSRTTSGVCVCFEVLCLSSLLSSVSAELIAASMSCELCSTCPMTSVSSGLWLLKLLERPAGVVLRSCGLSTLVFREE